jgi:phospholipase C
VLQIFHHFRRVISAEFCAFASVLVLAGCGGVSGKVTAAAPTVSIAANPTTVSAGTAATLSVTASNASKVTVSGSDGSSYTLPEAGGTQSVTPAATTTYTATATGPGGSATANSTVTVSAVTSGSPTVTISANPASIAAGSSSILTIVATNAAQVTLTGSDGSTFSLGATGGTQAVSPAATTTYTATAKSGSQSVTATAKVTVTPNPAPTVQITANPTSINAGASSTLTVTAVNATQVTLTGSDGSSYTLVNEAGGTQAVSPAATTTYTATATGPGGHVSASATVSVTANPAPTVTITANPTTVVTGNSSTLTVAATNATQVSVSGSDGTKYDLQPAGGSQAVTPTATTSYKVTATGLGGTVTASTSVTVAPPGSVQSIDHVIFLLQENHSFDNYFGMLNPYRSANHWDVGDDGVQYLVDGIDDKLNKITNSDDEHTAYSLFKLKSTCIDDDSSDWLSSYGDVNRYNFLDTRPIYMDGFVHTAEGFANSCANSGNCAGTFTDLTGRRAMGYYDQDFLNYYYYMASQFAVSDRWFSPMASKSVPNRLVTFTGGTSQGLVHDPGGNDHLPQLNIANIFQELDQAKVSWKIYYTVTQGFCLNDDDCLSTNSNKYYPAIHFSNFTYSYRFLNAQAGSCVAPAQPSSVVGDKTNSFCIDPTHIAPLSQYYTDLANNALPSFAFIEAGYGQNDEHPGSGQPVTAGQTAVAAVINALMGSSSWKDSVFFLSYDEGGGPYDHVPPVPGHSNDFNSASMGTIPDVSSISVNPDTNPAYFPCVPTTTPDLHCDLYPSDPGAKPADAAALQGFGAQIGFRVPNIVISPFTRKHYVSHIPMDHTAIIKFVENRFIGPSAHLTARDAAQPDLLDFFDFNATPWATPPTPPKPSTVSACTPDDMGP